MKKRLLHPHLAAVCAELRHGEMVYLADAGSGTHAKSLVPLAEDVEIIDLGVVTGVPSVADVLPVLYDVGDFEAAIVTEDMPSSNPEAHALVTGLFGTKNVHRMRYLPEFYDLRNRVKVFVQTGDYTVHANVILVAGFPSPDIPLEWLTSARWLADLTAAQNGSAPSPVATASN